MNTKLPRRRRLQPVTGLLLSVFSICSILLARTITVDDDGPAEFQRIQDAITAASAGDVVSVAPGSYSPPFGIGVGDGGLRLSCLPDKVGVSIVGVDSATTVITGFGGCDPDNGPYDPVITLAGCDSGTRLEGFTIANNCGAPTGGILVQGGSPIITRNVIIGNSALQGWNCGAYGADCRGTGGGIALSSSRAVVCDNVITGNAAIAGGGIHVTGGSPVISRNRISASTAGVGGGIHVEGAAPLITLNQLTGNRATFGGGIELDHADSPVISGNLIIGNTATGSGRFNGFGGGVDAYYSSPMLVNNTLASNVSEIGAGVSVVGSSGGEPALVNNVLYDNEASLDGGGVYLGVSTLQLADNIFFLNSPQNCGGAVASLCSLADNLVADPLFVDVPGGDYRLSAGSPAIDTGLETGAPATDLRGQRRPLDGDFDGASGFDRGAFEYDRDDVLGLRFGTPELLVWDPTIGATAYHMYSGGLDSLRRGGLDTCRDGQDSNRSDLAFAETRTPPVGSALIYVVTAVVGGAEGSPGFNSLGIERTLAVQCPICTSWSCPSCPVPEICNNAIDDDCDGLTDVLDSADCPCEVQECYSAECPPGYVCGFDGCCAPHCFDGVRNGDEGDVDCGGSCTTKCAPGQHCYGFYDCASGVCVNSICQ